MTDKEILAFGASWCVGKKNECEKKIKSSWESEYPRKKQNPCKFFKTGIFSPCHLKLNYNKYNKACNMDMNLCPHGKCYCESFMAYARECERLGVRLSNWQKPSFCDPNSLKRPKSSKSDYLKRNKQHKSHKTEDLLKQFQSIPVNRTRFTHKPAPIPLQ